MRKLPANIDAEKALLGSILLNADQNYNQLCDCKDLTYNDFYDNKHKIIYKLITNSNNLLDKVLLHEELKKTDTLVIVGGQSYIDELINIVPTKNTTEYANIIKKKSIARNLIQAGTEIMQLGLNPKTDIDEYISRSEELVFNATIKKSTIKEQYLPDLVNKSYELIEKASKGR